MSPNQHLISPPDCDAIQELIPDYAFGLTSAAETRLIESNLASCPDAVAQLADFRRMQDQLRADVKEIAPPPGLEDRLMAAIAEPSLPAAKPRPKTIRWAWVTAAAAVIALVLTNVYWLARVNAPLPTPSNPTSDTTSAQIAVQGDSTFVLTSASDLRWVRLPPSQQNNSNATAVLLWNIESEIGLLYVRGFPELSAGKTFQLWLTKGEERASAGTFQVDTAGNGALLFHLTDPIDRYTWARITEEPADGSTEPGDMVVVVGEL
jgi:anti-sigma-K factor RskA